MTYEPREDSFLLEKAVRRFASGRVLDMGTGTGILARAARGNSSDVAACDIDSAALGEARSRSRGIRFVLSDLFSSVGGKFDTIIFNPPYLPDGDPPDPALDGGRTGRELLDRFLAEAKAYLSPGGQLLFVQSSVTGNEETERRLDLLGYAWEAVFREKFFFEELVVFRAWVR